MTESEYDQEIAVLIQKKQDGIISHETFKHELQALKTIHGKIPRYKRCPVCASQGKITWGTHKKGAHFYCEEHEDSEIVGRVRSKGSKKSIEEIRKEKFLLDARILKCLHSEGSMTRNDLVGELNRARTTIYEHLRSLELRGFVISEKRKLIPGKGRAHVFWSVTEQFIKFDISRTKQKCSDKNKTKKQISRSSSEKAPTKKKPEDTISRTIIQQPTKKAEAEKCPIDETCECLLDGECMSPIWFKFKLCEGEPVQIENPLELSSNGSTLESTKKIENN